MLPDYHIHTPFCRHAEGEPAEFLAAARQANLPEICFTDHAPNPDNYDQQHRMGMAEFELYRAKIRAVSTDRNNGPASTGLQTRVLFGAEADYYEGCERFLREWLPHRPFDLVLGSVHFINDWGFDNPDEREVWDNVDVAGTWREYFKLIGRLAETKLFDVVGHLDLPKKFGFLPSEPVLKEMAGPALDKIAGAGMAIEINTSGLRKPVREIYPSLFLLGMARALDIPVCFGSDAHLPDEVGYEFACAMAWARQAGYSEAVRFAGRKQTRYALPVQHVAANPFPASGETGCRRAP